MTKLQIQLSSDFPQTKTKRMICGGGGDPMNLWGTKKKLFIYISSRERNIEPAAEMLRPTDNACVNSFTFGRI